MNFNFMKNKTYANLKTYIPDMSKIKKLLYRKGIDPPAKTAVAIEKANLKLVRNQFKKGSPILTKTSIFFDGMDVKIVTASIKKDKALVKNAISLEAGEFPDFLKKDKCKEYYVVFSPPSFYSNAISIPKVKSSQYIAPLLKNRLKDVKGTGEPFNIVFKDISAKDKEDKAKEFFTIAVDTKEIEDIISLFRSAKKDIRTLHTPFSSLLPLMLSLDKTALAIVKAGNSAYIIFVKDLSPVFIKKLKLETDNLSDTDTMQINMTINYISQTYQEMPPQIYLFSHSGNDGISFGNFSIPLCLFDTAKKVEGLPPDIAMEYILPIGALLAGAEFNLLPESYSSNRVIKSVTKKAGISFAAAALVLGLYFGLSIKEVLDTKAKVLSIRNKTTEHLGSAINYMSNLTNAPQREKIDMKSVEMFLVNLSNLLPEEIELEEFKITPKAGKWEVQMDGSAQIGSNAYTVIGMFVAQIKSLKNINVTESSMSVSDKAIKFTIKADYV